jgi:hypothetical protein
MKALWPVVALVLFALIAASCEVQPAELNFRCTLNGQPKGCQVMVFNETGAQIQEVPSEISGIGYIKDLKPGKYTLKFKDVKGTMYPAVTEVTLIPGDLQTIDVELSTAPAAGGDAAAGGTTPPAEENASGE